MALELGITSSGVDIPRLVDFLDEIEAQFESDYPGEQLGLTDPANARDVIVRLIGYVAAAFNQLAQQQQAIVDLLDPESAEGKQLRQLATIIGVLPVEATFSTASITITGDPGTPVPSTTFVVEGGGRGGVLARWALTEDVTLDGAGTATAVFRSTVKGAIPALAGTITGIVTPLTGVSSVTNAADAAIGLDEEQSGVLRTRMRQGLARRAGCGIPGVRSRILALEDSGSNQFIQAVSIVSNGDSEARTIQGIAMPGNAHLVTVLPNQLTTEQENLVLGVLYDSIVGSSSNVGTDVVGFITDDQGTQWPVSFDYGEDLTPTVAFTVTTKPNVAIADVQGAIELAIPALLPLTLGQTLYQVDLECLSGVVALVATISVLINGVDADLVPLLTQRVVALNVSLNGTSLGVISG